MVGPGEKILKIKVLRLIENVLVFVYANTAHRFIVNCDLSASCEFFYSLVAQYSNFCELDGKFWYTKHLVAQSYS